MQGRVQRKTTKGRLCATRFAACPGGAVWRLDGRSEEDVGPERLPLAAVTSKKKERCPSELAGVTEEEC